MATKAFWHHYMANLQVDVSMAAYTKVPITWYERDFLLDFNKFYYIQEGEGYLELDGERYYPKPGELYLLPAGKLQSIGTLSENTFGKFWCHFTARVGDVNLFDLFELPLSIQVQNHEEMSDLFRKLIFHAQGHEMTDILRTQSALLAIVASYLEQSSNVSLKAKPIPSFGQMNQVLAYIDKHLAEQLTVETLARVTHYQPKYFIHQFKRLTGQTPIQYVTRKRLERAANQLLLTSLSISEIAEGNGMELSYFSRKFKAHSGFSPSEFREIMQ